VCAGGCGSPSHPPSASHAPPQQGNLVHPPLHVGEGLLCGPCTLSTLLPQQGICLSSLNAPLHTVVHTHPALLLHPDALIHSFTRSFDKSALGQASCWARILVVRGHLAPETGETSCVCWDQGSTQERGGRGEGHSNAVTNRKGWGRGRW
jgi:hypothetical protein